MSPQGDASSAAVEQHLAADLRSLAFSLRTLVRRAPVTCGERDTVRTAVQSMQREGIGSIIVTDAAARPVGIFTERDLLGLALGERLDVPIATVMTPAPLALPDSAPAYEAALAMVERGIRHVLVTDGGTMIGVVSERDLFSLQRLGLGELTIEIRRATQIEALAVSAARVRRLTRLLVDQGVAAEQLTMFVSLLNDRICERIVELVRRRHALDRLSWCWLAFGSEGRLEQTFATDQDNGLLFQAHDGISPESARKQLLPFAREVNEALDACGFPLCKGNVMASNPDLCRSLAEWKAKIEGWLAVSDPKALLDAAICLDMRALSGDGRLAAALRSWFLGITRVRQNFLRLLAQNALQARPPLSKWRGQLVVEDAADAPQTINLKRDAIRPVVDCARLFALAHALVPTNTAERLRAAGRAGVYPPPEVDAMVAAFYHLQQLRLRHQAALDSFAGDNANRIAPAALNEFERRALKDALRLVRELQARIALDFQL